MMRDPQRLTPGVRIYFHVWEFPLTRAGKLLMGAILISGLLGAVAVEIPVFRLCAALVALSLTASTCGSLFRWAKLDVQGGFPKRITAGETLTGEFRVTNRGRLPVFDLDAGCFRPPPGWTPATDREFCPHLPPGATTALHVALAARRRGVYELPPVRFFSTFPFNVCRNEITTAPGGCVHVLPRFPTVRGLQLDVDHRHQPGGISLTSNVGESPEYIGNRDYQPGDVLRRIDFRCWARLARPVVKEYQEEYFSRVALILDTQSAVPPGREDAAFEAAVSLLAGIVDAVCHGEHVVDLFAAGPQLYLFRTGRRLSLFDHVLDLLAGVGTTAADPFEVLGPALAGEWPRISAAVFVLLDWNESRRGVVRQARESGCRVKRIIVHDDPPRVNLGEDVDDVTLLTPSQVHDGPRAGSVSDGNFSRFETRPRPPFERGEK